MSLGTLYHSGHVLYLARAAYVRAESTKSEAEVCIALCASALEGSLNEVAHLFQNAEHPETAVALAAVLSEAEASRLSPIAKFRLAAFALSGSFPRNGDTVVQGLTALFRLRNSFLHLRPEPMFTLDESQPNHTKDAKPPSEVQHLVSAGIVTIPVNFTGSWRQLVSTPEVAAWAYTTTYESMHWLASQARESSVAKALEVVYGFTPPLSGASVA